MIMAQEERAFVDMTGTYRAVAREWDFGFVNNDPDRPQVGVLFELLDGDFQGRTVQWYGFFTPKTEERTLESLRHCGWSSADIIALDGMGSTEVSLVIAAEEYDGKWSNKVQWVNKPARVYMKNAMDANAKQAFAARMRGLAVQSQQSYFGGAAPARQAAPRTQQSQPQQSSRPAPGGAFAPRGAPSRPPKTESGYDPGPDAPYDDDIPF